LYRERVLSEADKNEFRLTQRGLIDKLVQANGLTDCKLNYLPGSLKALGSDPDGEPMNEDWHYGSICGMLLYQFVDLGVSGCILPDFDRLGETVLYTEKTPLESPFMPVGSKLTVLL
jgi:hypothetical protein